jgi:hypothetical protein
MGWTRPLRDYLSASISGVAKSKTDSTAVTQPQPQPRPIADRYLLHLARGCGIQTAIPLSIARRRRRKSRIKLRTGLLRGRERDLDWPKRHSVRARKTDVVNIV